ncbi:MAG: 2-oxo acid dehydrogenase subunit E2 [Rhodobacterales bacterium]|nr:2-oxo acid dehydrogenase subunit E2 [Rhodobacterales bacterium]MDX5389193.1 2-oxo acid dehydrogenase subunit E2 [Rhodobacterales bacterium]MDX5488890.1 2-oxo acid dehydrogenase subunit E2 [Rhodobacterales bacterium]
MGLFAMPSLGADMEAGRLAEWLVAPGDVVRRGDVVAVVETQKGAIEVETFEAGTVQRLIATIGQELPVGAPMALILAEGETAPSDVPAVALPEPTMDNDAEQGPPPADLPEDKPRVHGAAASPAARARAQALGIALSQITGHGPDGAILLADVEAAALAAIEPAQGPRADVRPGPGTEMRRAIAAAMTRSKQTIPHVYLSQTIDIQDLADRLNKWNAARVPAARILLGALFLRATARAAVDVPQINGHWVEDAFVPGDSVNVGVAIALRGGGLVAPAMMSVDTLTLPQVMAGMRDLVTRARAGRLRASEMTKGTLTMSSLGETGAEAMTGVIFPPQVALVGIGAPHVRPWVVGGAVEPRLVINLTISADHRALDGRLVSRFIAAFETHLQSPEGP